MVTTTFNAVKTGLFAFVLACASLSLVPATSAAADPRGNNGTVKIDRVEFDSHPNNEPHVTCSFQVDFYGYDAGVGNANVKFELQNPTKNDRTMTVTSGDLTPNIGQDAAGGGTDLDASETYALGFTGAPHDRQGYHVKLTVHAPGSKNSDVKHKVFWVKPCAAPSAPGGHVLADAASTTRTQPAQIPSTGIGTGYLLATLAAMTLTYTLMKRRFAEIDS